MGELTRLGDIAAFRRVLRERLDGRSSHDVGPEPRSRIPPGCTGNPDPMARDHHRDRVVADRWARACAAGNCQYVDPYAMKPDKRLDCPGHRGERKLVGGRCVVTWPGHCARRQRWGEVHEQTGKHAKPVRSGPLLASDERVGRPAAPPNALWWDREPGEEG